MKKLVALMLLAGMVAAFGLVPAHAADTTTGTILLPTLNLPDVTGGVAPSGVFTRQERCVFLLGGDATNGVLGWHVALTDVQADGNHTFSLTSTTSGATPYVVFYDDLGTCDGVSGPGASTTSLPETGTGTVPQFSTDALIVIDGAVNSDFTFTVSAPAA